MIVVQFYKFTEKVIASLRWEGRFSTSGCSWSSIHLEMLVVADLIVHVADRTSGRWAVWLVYLG